ncbi:replication protein [Secundilactobacillus mixtipabuli]|uniref:Replication protein n=1 Tax=Secundilactobacillus mixtipabuli TaxID=1435342 RepID=A0A1Z5ID35_9LACO|nr:replication protein [Secundilactobacillus mixtipabuli]GAW99585.1 replication protein [Secundilactobacillus mixtipabuli]
MTKKEQRSSKWAFLMYKDSAPENYQDVLDSIHVPYVLSPWHDKDIVKDTGELKKVHKHGALFFDSLKGYHQVSELISDKLNGPAHVEVVQSPKGMLDYFTHANNPEKTQYDEKDIECGSGFNLRKFLMSQSNGTVINDVIDIIEEKNFVEFMDLVNYARENNQGMLNLIVDKTYFVSKLLDSRRYDQQNKIEYEEDKYE